MLHRAYQSTDRRNSRGSVLATVVIVAAVLFGLVAVAYTYFTMNARTAAFTMKRTRAMVSAEAGVALAGHYLESLDRLPPSGEPFLLEMPEDSSGWTLLPGGGRVMVVIDPLNIMGGPIDNGAVQVRARGRSGDLTRDLFAGVAPAYPSSYGLLVDGTVSEGFFTDGREIGGPVHANGRIYFSSYTPDSLNDPSATMFSTTSDGGFYFTGYGRSDVAHPEGSSVWVMPYSMHRQGPPHWNPSTPSMDYARMISSFRSLLNTPEGGGVLRISAERVLLDGSSLRYRDREEGDERTADLSHVELVILSNGFSPVMIKTVQRTEHPITIISRNDLYLGGGIDGGVAGSGGPLGLVAMGDMVIPADPDITGDDDWPGQWSIETDRPFLVRAVLAVPSGSLRAAVPYQPDDAARVTVTGSLSQHDMGRLTSAGSGYDLWLNWDQGLGAVHPPGFPMLGRWTVYSWLLDPPEQEGISLEDDQV